ncbi:MAG: plasmid mobilization relaxosome protein MobC [Psychrobacillus sp.]|uniref:plasmid mobilization protein n=1 Tax=Carnobacterium inhibens TaxID=147709 RepID=UPI003315BAE6
MVVSKEVKFRLTESELALASKVAEKYDMSINALAKFLVLNLEAPATKTDREFMKELNVSIGRIGNNLNQLARQVNSSSVFYSSEKEQVMKSLLEIRNDTRQLAGKETLSEEEFRKEGQAILRSKRNFF